MGTLTRLDAAELTLQTRAGDRTLPRAAVVAARPVGANRRDILELERISRRGWRAATRIELDGWLVFADQGWTGRANSALPLHSLTRPLDDVLAELSDFYTRRGLVTQIQIPQPARDSLDDALAERGWTVQRPTVVLTRSLGNDRPRSENPAVFAAVPDDNWINAYHYRGGRLPDFAIELLTRHDLVTFASISSGPATVAIGRGVVDEGWLGITAVEVEQAHRRQGLARQIVRGLFDWGRTRGAERCYLQVDEVNSAAQALYRGLGFIEHHRYHYRVAPA